MLVQGLLQNICTEVPDRAAVRWRWGRPRSDDFQRHELHDARRVWRHQHQLERRNRTADGPQPLQISGKAFITPCAFLCFQEKVMVLYLLCCVSSCRESLSSNGRNTSSSSWWLITERWDKLRRDSWISEAWSDLSSCSVCYSLLRQRAEQFPGFSDPDLSHTRQLFSQNHLGNLSVNHLLRNRMCSDMMSCRCSTWRWSEIRPSWDRGCLKSSTLSTWWVEPQRKWHKPPAGSDNIQSYSREVIIWIIRLDDTVCFPAGVQTPEDLRGSGGVGDLVQRRSDHRDAAGWSEPGRLHEVEKLGAGDEDKARQRASHQVRTAFNHQLIHLRDK